MSDPDPSTLELAARTRAVCNGMTREERDAAQARAMERIGGEATLIDVAHLLPAALSRANQVIAEQADEMGRLTGDLTMMRTTIGRLRDALGEIAHHERTCPCAQIAYRALAGIQASVETAPPGDERTHLPTTDG